jgi:hypothetical protein
MLRPVSPSIGHTVLPLIMLECCVELGCWVSYSDNICTVHFVCACYVCFVVCFWHIFLPIPSTLLWNQIDWTWLLLLNGIFVIHVVSIRKCSIWLLLFVHECTLGVLWFSLSCPCSTSCKCWQTIKIFDTKLA